MVCFIAEFRAYFDHVKSLRFEDRPDYDFLKRMFRELFFRKGFMYDHVMDWDLHSSKAGAQSRAVEGEAKMHDTVEREGHVAFNRGDVENEEQFNLDNGMDDFEQAQELLLQQRQRDGLAPMTAVNTGAVAIHSSANTVHVHGRSAAATGVMKGRVHLIFTYNNSLVQASLNHGHVHI